MAWVTAICGLQWGYDRHSWQFDVNDVHALEMVL